MSSTATERPVVLAGKPVATTPSPSVDRGKITEPTVLLAATKRAPRRRLGWLAIVSTGLVVGVVGWQAYARVAHDKSSATGDAPGQPARKADLGFVAGDAAGKSGPAKQYETVPVEVVSRSHTLRLTGTLIADEKSSVVANASGVAARVLVDRGSLVKKNDVLVEIDPTDANNKLEEGKALVEELRVRLGLDANPGPFQPENQPEVRLAKAAMDLAASNLRRATDLHAKKVLTAEAYDQVKTEHELASQRYAQALQQIRQVYQSCKTAAVRLAILQKALDDTKIRAPFDGAVAEKLVEAGEQISSGMQATKVITLVRIDRLRLSLTVPQQSVGLVRQGQTVRFRVDSFANRTFTAEVKYITPIVTNETRSLVVEAVVDNREGALRPGLFATADLVLQAQQPAMYLPTSAVQKMDEVARVFIVRDGAAREQVVALGEENAEKVEIRSGLTGKEMVLARPEQVRDGAPVRLDAAPR